MQLTVRLSPVHVLSPPPSFSNALQYEVRTSALPTCWSLRRTIRIGEYSRRIQQSYWSLPGSPLGATLPVSIRMLVAERLCDRDHRLSEASDLTNAANPLLPLSPPLGPPKGKAPLLRGLKSECQNSEGFPTTHRMIFGCDIRVTIARRHSRAYSWQIKKN